MVHYPRPFGLSGHLLSHSNSFGFEMEKDVAGCRAFNRMLQTLKKPLIKTDQS